jgi:hypothetical protein
MLIEAGGPLVLNPLAGMAVGGLPSAGSLAYAAGRDHVFPQEQLGGLTVLGAGLMGLRILRRKIFHPSRKQ